MWSAAFARRSPAAARLDSRVGRIFTIANSEATKKALAMISAKHAPRAMTIVNIRPTQTGSSRRAVLVEPAQQRLDAPGGERDAGIRGAVIEVDRVAVGIDGVAARKGDIADVAVFFVLFLGTEDPF